MKCPGQDSRYWKPGAIFEAKCPKCGQIVEFFKDDPARKCRRCGHRFVNPNMDFGCASYCEFAEQCLGNLPPELLAQKEDLLKDRVAIEMKRRYRSDFKKIGHAMRAARYAEQIGKQEQGNLAVILSAAYLYNMDPQEAGDILGKLGAQPALVEEVCQIVENRLQPGDSLNAQVVNDAERIAELADRDRDAPMSKPVRQEVRQDAFHTVAGRAKAQEVLAAEAE